MGEPIILKWGVELKKYDLFDKNDNDEDDDEEESKMTIWVMMN